jgi:hypothetical protein
VAAVPVKVIQTCCRRVLGVTQILIRWQSLFNNISKLQFPNRNFAASLMFSLLQVVILTRQTTVCGQRMAAAGVTQ